MRSKLFRHRRYSACPALLIALALPLAGCGREDQAPKQATPSQAPASPPGQPPPAATPQAPAVPPGAAPASAALPTLSPLESLVAPIALYPDPLLAELLVASTYPLEVVQAARWLDTKPDPGALKSKDWDASILRLAEVPSVLKMMSDHLDWTTQLGDAFLAKPEAVMDTIQSLRRRASEAGFLKDTPEQKVSKQTVAVPQPAEPADSGGIITAQPAVVRKEIVRIEPTKPDTVYVPQYSPQAAYSATPAPPPASPASSGYAGYAYPAVAPAPTYYPSYYPAPATATTSSSTDQLLTFGAGALVGGLMTWGIMEWADDDWDDHYHGGGYYPPVSHNYGNTVCRSGNCWHGGGYGGGYNTANVDRVNVNISGNEINVDRNGYFKTDQLTALKQREGWQPEARHRRGQPYPAAAEDRLGRIESPALAGDRLGAAQTLPATARGFNGGTARRPETPRPTAGEVRQRLGQDTKAQRKSGGGQVANRPASTDVRQRLEQGNRPNALENVRDRNQNIQREAGRGAVSRQQAQLAARDKMTAAARDTGAKPKPERDRRQELGSTPRAQEFKATSPQSVKRSPPGGGRDLQPIRDNQRRVETARPNAFENAADRGGTQAFSRRGAASRQTMAAARPAASGGAGFQGGRSGAGQFQGGGGGRRGRR
ncbi:DUF3300 domain-containing protein [Methylomagnum sp.]